MFEFFVAFKYLIPKKRALSTSLISLMSIFVISLVVWLILVFLSVTTGIEKNWLHKLTSINAPLRIVPTDDYYNSYYYLIDKISAKSNYSTKTIGEKKNSNAADGYNPNEDIEIPYYWPKPDTYNDGSSKDLVKALLNILGNKYPNIPYQDFEVSGALMRLSLYRTNENNSSFYNDEKLSFISQMSYLISHTGKNPNFSALAFAPDVNDLNNLASRLDKSSDSILQETPSLISNNIPSNESKSYLHRFFDNVDIKKMITEKGFNIPLSFFQKNESVTVYAFLENNKITAIKLVNNETENISGMEKGIITSEDGINYFFKSNNNLSYKIKPNTIITASSPLIFDAKVNEESISNAKNISDVLFTLSCKIQGKPLSGKAFINKLKIFEATAKTKFELPPENEPLWPYEKLSGSSKSEIILPKHKDFGVILPRSLRESGVLIGDSGYFSFTAKTAVATQEERLPIYVAGFYDPGIFSVGNRCIIVPDEITKTISGISAAFAPEGIPSNGIFLWTKDLAKVDQIKNELINDLKKEGIAHYWNVQTYKDYEFAKDLMQQFQSDRLLFILVAIIIIIVACSNIISLLVLLVNDKKKEIAVLQALGASKKSIAIIFGSCGVIMGTLSSLIGSMAAIYTLKHIDLLVRFLSSIQGHDAFNAAFFGEKLPNVLSVDALIFILIITPIISLFAGLIPAIKASKLDPSQILRAD
jgi:lipoprotein-releasing system permease protein